MTQEEKVKLIEKYDEHFSINDEKYWSSLWEGKRHQRVGLRDVRSELALLAPKEITLKKACDMALQFANIHPKNLADHEDIGYYKGWKYVLYYLIERSGK